MINFILLLIILTVFFLACYYIHKKRVGARNIASYFWFTKLLR